MQKRYSYCELNYMILKMCELLVKNYGGIRYSINKEAFDNEVFSNQEIIDFLIKNEDLLYRQQLEFAFYGKNSSKIFEQKSEIINLGSGWGSLSRFICKNNPNCDVYNVDKNIEILKLSQKYDTQIMGDIKNRMKYYNLDVCNTPMDFEIQFDYVISMGMIRYIDDVNINGLIMKIMRLKKDNGKGILVEVEDVSTMKFANVIKSMKIEYETESKSMEIFKQTKFYLLYFMYKNKQLNNVAIIEKYLGMSLGEFKHSIDEISNENKIGFMDVLKSLAGKSVLRVDRLIVHDYIKYLCLH